MLDEAGLQDAKICVSNSLDENLISSLLNQGAPIDTFGVGENMITAKSQPVFGGVYKLVALEKQGQIVPKIKISDNIEKITNPHFKKIVRIYDENNKLITDLLCIHDEKIPSKSITLKHPENNWITKTITNFKAIELKKKMIENGKVIYTFPTIEQTRQKVQQELATLWPEALRLQNPHAYVINLSDKLLTLKKNLLNEHKTQTAVDIKALKEELDKLNAKKNEILAKKKQKATQPTQIQSTEIENEK